MIWAARLLRLLAVAIAIAAAIDPALALTRPDRAVVSVIDAGGGAATAQISHSLSETLDVHDGPIAAAAATVVVGETMPDPSIVTSGALFAVLPVAAVPRIDIEDIAAPPAASSGSRIPVVIHVRAVGMRGRSLTAELFDGLLAVDSITRAVAADDDRAEVAMALPPAAAGLARVRVIVHDAADRSRQVSRTFAIDIRDQRWRVLVADPRPSWTSTFVRRALEDDRRFDVTSRVGTSKSVAVQSGDAPALGDVSALSAFDAVVVGAPDALGAGDVRSLERYARERGGAIVLLLDRADPGPLSPLLGGVALADVHGVTRVKAAGAAGTLIATELAVPRGGSGVIAIAHANVGGADAPLVWSASLGAGRVLVNGALDAWRYRTREGGGFAKFWADAIGTAAAASPQALTLTTESATVSPGAAFSVRAIVRDAELSDPARPAPAVDLESTADFWPAAERGVFRATVKAPDTPGNYEIKVQSSRVSGFQGSAGSEFQGSAILRYIVAAPEPRAERALLAAWTTSRGGTVLDGSVSDAVSRVRAAAQTRTARVETHPMRSIWWLPAFVMLLGGEWWIRRRRGAR